MFSYGVSEIAETAVNAMPPIAERMNNLCSFETQRIHRLSRPLARPTAINLDVTHKAGEHRGMIVEVLDGGHRPFTKDHVPLRQLVCFDHDRNDIF